MYLNNPAHRSCPAVITFAEEQNIICQRNVSNFTRVEKLKIQLEVNKYLCMDIWKEKNELVCTQLSLKNYTHRG